jgi:hypothetical protein
MSATSAYQPHVFRRITDLKSTGVSIDERFGEFVAGDDTLQVYRHDNLVFSSSKDRVVPLLEFIDSLCPDDGPVVLFDKVMGNAAALLAVKARAGEVYSPLGSELAIETLRKNDIAYHLDRVIPFIQKDNSEEMCFMENLSRGKTPDEFYTTIKAIIK